MFFINRLTLVALLVGTCATANFAQSPRLIIDDDQYVEHVTKSGEKLLREHKLVSLDVLRNQVRTKGMPLKLVPLAHEKLDAADLCDRLRESTLAVGTFYKCPDCGGWHFTSSTGFVLGENGLVCTCCHVIT